MSGPKRFLKSVQQEMARSRDEREELMTPSPQQASRQRHIGHVAVTETYIQELHQASESAQSIDLDPDMPAVA